ncbi:MAG: hypothetical protein H7268_00905 [Sandarakinorhabdus sp.]|nr:hypothetical protein [Sandarakinorhabdus sp.]
MALPPFGHSLRPVRDQLAIGSKLRILAVVDSLTNLSPAGVPRFRFTAPDVIEVLALAFREVRRHDPIGNKPPISLANCSTVHACLGTALAGKDWPARTG